MNGTFNTTRGRGPRTSALLRAAALFVIAVIALIGSGSGSLAQEASSGPAGVSAANRAVPDDAPEDHQLTGPYTYKNLTIYLVHGKDKIAGKYITLQEALAKKKVVVFETGDVNELAIQNKSDQQVFIQSGDIVKGGQQDRVLGYDLVLAPHSKRLPISAYCVEHGRWSGRGSESDHEFNSSDNQLVGRELKLAAKYHNDQGKVWQKVDETQNKLSEKVGVSVRSEQSESSLELALRNDKVKGSADEYVNALQSIIVGQSDVIGYVFAINGAINSADMYASNELFGKLWPKLLRSSAVEAVEDFDDTVKFVEPSADTVRATLSDAERGSLKDTREMTRSTVTTQESDNNVMFETRDRSADGVWLHRNYLKK